MGFDFGSFAGGLASGIEKGEKLRLARDEAKAKREARQQKIEEGIAKTNKEAGTLYADSQTSYKTEMGKYNDSSLSSSERNEALLNAKNTKEEFFIKNSAYSDSQTAQSYSKLFTQDTAELENSPTFKDYTDSATGNKYHVPVDGNEELFKVDGAGNLRYRTIDENGNASDQVNNNIIIKPIAKGSEGKPLTGYDKDNNERHFMSQESYNQALLNNSITKGKKDKKVGSKEDQIKVFKAQADLKTYSAQLEDFTLLNDKVKVAETQAKIDVANKTIELYNTEAGSSSEAMQNFTKDKKKVNKELMKETKGKSNLDAIGKVEALASSYNPNNSAHSKKMQQFTAEAGTDDLVKFYKDVTLNSKSSASADKTFVPLLQSGSPNAAKAFTKVKVDLLSQALQNPSLFEDAASLDKIISDTKTSLSLKMNKDVKEQVMKEEVEPLIAIREGTTQELYAEEWDKQISIYEKSAGKRTGIAQDVFMGGFMSVNEMIASFQESFDDISPQGTNIIDKTGNVIQDYTTFSSMANKDTFMESTFAKVQLGYKEMNPNEPMLTPAGFMRMLNRDMESSVFGKDQPKAGSELYNLMIVSRNKQIKY